MSNLTHASLFSGIGGFDLASQWAGWTNVFNCENNPFCKKVLKYHFPNAIQYDDIKATKFKQYRGTIAVVSGGFPCQPFSSAGKRKGTADNRYLWEEMLRAIREIQPRWVVAENVRGIITQADGLVFERVHSDLENTGYTVQSFIIPACAVGAPHERYRVFFVAHRADTRAKSMRKRTKQVHQDGTTSNTDSNRCRNGENKQIDFYECEGTPDYRSCRENGNTPNTLRIGLEYSLPSRYRRTEFKNKNIPNWEKFPTFSPVCSRDDGVPAGLDGITFPKWRKESIRAYGNAVVPQVAYAIFRIINEIEKSVR